MRSQHLLLLLPALFSHTNAFVSNLIQGPGDLLYVAQKLSSSPEVNPIDKAKAFYKEKKTAWKTYNKLLDLWTMYHPNDLRHRAAPNMTELQEFRLARHVWRNGGVNVNKTNIFPRDEVLYPIYHAYLAERTRLQKEAADKLQAEAEAKAAADLTVAGKQRSEEAEAFLRQLNETLIRAGDPNMTKMPLNKMSGMSEIKQQLMTSVIMPMKARPRARHLNKTIPAVSGVVLFGPPGCGKSTIAIALADAVGANLLSVTNMQGPYMGQGEAQVDAVWEIAEQNQPCVIFIDEIDSFLSVRDHSSARLAIQFFGRWDKAKRLGHDILVIGGTNFPNHMDVLLKSRFTLKFGARLPATPKERADIFASHFTSRIEEGKWNSFINSTDMLDLGALTSGWSGADMATISQKTIAIAGYSLNNVLLLRNDTLSIQAIKEKKVNRDHLMRAFTEHNASKMQIAEMEAKRVAAAEPNLEAILAKLTAEDAKGSK